MFNSLKKYPELLDVDHLSVGDRKISLRKIFQRDIENNISFSFNNKLIRPIKKEDGVSAMNTADRSVEALDTALRRRFQFVEMSPRPEVIEEVNGRRDVKGIDLVILLETINNRIEVLLDRDIIVLGIVTSLNEMI